MWPEKIGKTATRAEVWRTDVRNGLGVSADPVVESQGKIRKHEYTNKVVPLLDRGKLRCLKAAGLTHARTARLGVRAYRLGDGAYRTRRQPVNQSVIPWRLRMDLPSSELRDSANVVVADARRLLTDRARPLLVAID